MLCIDYCRKRFQRLFDFTPHYVLFYPAFYYCHLWLVGGKVSSSRSKGIDDRQREGNATGARAEQSR